MIETFQLKGGISEISSDMNEVGKKKIKYLIEDILALSSDEYLRSIEEARTDYKEGKVKYLEEIF